MSDLVRDHVEVGKGALGVAPDGNNCLRLERLEQPNQDWTTGFALSASMAAVRARITQLMGMEREDVPEENGPPHVVECLPDHLCGALSHRGPSGRASQRRRTKKAAMG